jgi:hypothetical protein
MTKLPVVSGRDLVKALAKICNLSPIKQAAISFCATTHPHIAATKRLPKEPSKILFERLA